MFGTGFILFINIVLLAVIGAVLQTISYYNSKPVVDVASLIIFIFLIILAAFFKFGWIIAIVLSATIIASKLHKFYKFGAVAFLIALILANINVLILTHLYIGLIFRPFGQ